MVKVIGVGDNVVDKYLHKNVMYPGGNAVNVAVFAKMLGAEAAYLGIYGTDRAGDLIRDTLSLLGLDQSHCRLIDGENGYSSVNLVDGDRTYVGGNAGGVSKTFPLKLDEEDLAYISQYDLVHTSCYSYIEPELPKLKETKTAVSFDFSNRFTAEYGARVCPYVDISLISCGHLSDGEITEVIRTAHAAGCPMVLTSMGRRGARLSLSGRTYIQPSGREKAVDTLGAGDAFFTAFAVNYLTEGGNFREADNTADRRIVKSLRAAADFATRICMREGAFGYGAPIKEMPPGV